MFQWSLSNCTDPADRLRRPYHLALGLIACLTLLSQLVVQSSLRRLEDDAPAIKLAGNQLTLSKQLSKDALELSVAATPQRVAEEMMDLRTHLERFKTVHRGLQFGDEGLQIPGHGSERLSELLARVEPHFVRMTAAAQEVLDRVRDTTLSASQRRWVDDQAARISAAEHQFADAMDDVVWAYESEAQGRLAAMKRLELALMGVTLMALVIEAVLVFRPAARTIRGQIIALQQQTADLQKARIEAESASQAKTCFLTNMSHEIRTPMTMILGYADQLRDPALPAADRARFVDRINTAGQHLTVLINNILDLAGSESAALAVIPVRCSPRQIVADVVANLLPRASAKKLPLTVSCRGRLPASVQTDPARLRTILTHLVENAIKFTERGAVTVALSLPDPAAEKLRIDVIDTGCGIGPEQQRRLFQPFMQADESLTRREGGLGIGLVLARRMAVALGGDVTVNSDSGHGSTFTVHIATGALAGVEMVREDVAVMAHPAAPAAAGTLDAARGKRLLVVDDAADIQRLLQFVLTKCGASVTIAHHGEAGVEAVLDAHRRRQPFDLVFMDMQMPVMDGYAATRRLRELGQALPIIALTAHAMTGDREKCLSAGCTDYCTKPVDRNRLLEMIERHAATAAVKAA